MDFTTIQVSHSGAAAAITLDRPEKLNPLSTTTLLELVEAARLMDTRPEVKVVVVAGAGRAFSAGADLGAFSAGTDLGAFGAGGTGGTGEAGGAGGTGSQAAVSRQAADAGRRMAEAIESMRAVTVARLHGHVVGGGVVLASACDLRVAAEETRFSIPEVDLGIPLAWGGIPRLVRDIGPALAKELVMTCRPFDADEAWRAGFLNRVVPLSELDHAVEELVTTLLTKSALTLTATKAHVNAVTESMVGTGRAWNDADSLVTALRDPESRAAGAAYLDRVRKR